MQPFRTEVENYTLGLKKIEQFPFITIRQGRLAFIRHMQNVTYDFSSVHVDVPNPLAEEIIAWGKDRVSDNDIFVSQQPPTYGREDEMHATILYGLHSEFSDQVKNLVVGEGPIHVKLGRIEVFSNPLKFDVVVINIISPDLCRINECFRNEVCFTNNYDGYRPHVTIAYVKKGKGWKHRDKELWNGREFICDNIVFSSKNGIKERIHLQ